MTMRMVLAGFLISSAVFAQVHSPAGRFMQHMEKSRNDMERNMLSAPMNGEVDHDFAAMMIPHHKGALDMAEAELMYGKDPQMRRLAQEIVTDQQSEIELMQVWLKQRERSSQK